MSDVYQALGEILGEELGRAPVPLTAQTELDDLPGWDSATLAGVILAIEFAFGVSITRDQLGPIETGADLARLCQPPPA
jgi:acyl carrier protein